MTRRNPLANQTNAVTLASDAGAELAPPLRYDYDLIAEEHRSPLMLAARRIKMMGNRIRTDLIHIGRELTEAKQRLPHGQFGDWLAVEFEMSDRSARRFMRIYEGWGDNPEAISLLSDKALYLLADPDTPEEAKHEAVETARTTGRSPTAKQTHEIIAAHKPPPPTTIEMPDSDDLEDTSSHDGDELEPQNLAAPIASQPELIDHEVGALRHLVTMEAHIWRIALLEVDYDLAKLHQWIQDHDQPDPYGRTAIDQPDTFAEAYAVVSQEIARKYDYGSEDPLPPNEEVQPQDMAAPLASQHNWRINQFTAALGRIQEMDFEQYSNMTGDWSSPRKLKDIIDVMIHKLEGNLR